ncbi:replication factor A protein 3 [Suillus fuscotomentosus]|uniref:Replication factor A protein 3 n=1 Tax=Suillus fuscotomentosus TaxID=1912939 RepID=A0AAD4HMK1_9AGAM|nr:replication factor A protein 3 [Suillus fuscotomentosus]KAG1902128.1 replication factor A protein 3 [Suillus fuscotomentosus]
MNEHISMRVNSARLSGIKGRTVRLPCKVLRMTLPSFEASDGGQVEIQRKNVDMTATYVEVIGNVVDASTIKAMATLPLDSEGELDMQLVNDVIELTFESRFDKLFPRYKDT